MEMNDCLELHKTLSQAEVEYQRKFDQVKNFELSKLMPNSITNIEQELEAWEKLKTEEQIAYDKREIARKVYRECLKGRN